MVSFFERIAALQRDGQSFAVATVVGRRAPVSAHLGDRAIVFADGRMEGFVGGACAREIVRRQALESLQARHGRLVSIGPDAAGGVEPTAEHVLVPMRCESEGAVDVFVEPFVQARALVVVGATPVAAALARLGRSMDYRVTRIVDARERGDLDAEAAALGVTVATLDELAATLGGGVDTAVVVASQGHYDEETLDVTLRSRVSYVGLVASRKRGATIRALLEGRGVPRLADLRNPAGVDLGARTAPEVALSILAEIVQAMPAGTALAAAPAAALDAAAPPQAPTTAVDPVCGMEVEVADARHTAAIEGVIHYFCCAHCRERYVKQPSDFRQATP